MIQIVIMASGYSRRMGKDKLCATLGGKPVIKWVVEAAKNAGDSPIHLIYRDPCMLDIANCLGIEPLYNPWSFLGQSAGLRVAAESLLPAKPILCLAGDQPLITSDTLKRMMNRFKEDRPDILCASCHGNRTLPTLFSSTMTRHLMGLEGDTGGRTLIASGLFRVEYEELAFEEEQWDIDTDEDLIRIGKWLERIRETGIVNGKQTP